MAVTIIACTKQIKKFSTELNCLDTSKAFHCDLAQSMNYSKLGSSTYTAHNLEPWSHDRLNGTPCLSVVCEALLYPGQ